jgi:transketolase C-terminal domain/subunit
MAEMAMREAYGRALADYGEKNLQLVVLDVDTSCLLYTSPSPRDRTRSRMPSSA